MSKDVFEPFNDDVGKHGGYVYSTTTQKSALYSAEKNTKLLLDIADFDGKSILDLGCGDGYYTNQLWTRSNAKIIMGIDPASNSIRIANDKYGSRNDGLTFRNCFSDDLVREKNHFDIAICRGVLHHVGDPPKEINNILNLADTVYIIEPNGLNIILKMMEIFSKYHREHKEQSYTMSTLKTWIATNGGCVKKAFYHGLVPYFCPDIILRIGRVLEPIIEPIPILNAFLCGRQFIVVKKRP